MYKKDQNGTLQKEKAENSNYLENAFLIFQQLENLFQGK